MLERGRTPCRRDRRHETRVRLFATGGRRRSGGRHRLRPGRRHRGRIDTLLSIKYIMILPFWVISHTFAGPVSPVVAHPDDSARLCDRARLGPNRCAGRDLVTEGTSPPRERRSSWGPIPKTAGTSAERRQRPGTGRSQGETPGLSRSHWSWPVSPAVSSSVRVRRVRDRSDGRRRGARWFAGPDRGRPHDDSDSQ